MKEYKVTSDCNAENDIFLIKVRTYINGQKFGFVMEFTEEWLDRHACLVAEGQSYPRIRVKKE